MKKFAILNAAIALVILATSHQASAQCSGWPVTCTGINPSGGGINPAVAGAAAAGAWAIGTMIGNALANAPANTPTYTPQQKQASEINLQAVEMSKATSANFDCAHRDFLLTRFRRMESLEKQAISLWPENKTFRFNLALDYAQAAIVKRCYHPTTPMTKAEMTEAWRFYSYAHDLVPTAEFAAQQTRYWQEQLTRAQDLPMPDLRRRMPVSDPDTLKQIELNRVRQAQNGQRQQQGPTNRCPTFGEPHVVCGGPSPGCCPGVGNVGPYCVSHAPTDCTR